MDGQGAGPCWRTWKSWRHQAGRNGCGTASSTRSSPRHDDQGADCPLMPSGTDRPRDGMLSELFSGSHPWTSERAAFDQRWRRYRGAYRKRRRAFSRHGLHARCGDRGHTQARRRHRQPGARDACPGWRAAHRKILRMRSYAARGQSAVHSQRWIMGRWRYEVRRRR